MYNVNRHSKRTGKRKSQGMPLDRGAQTAGKIQAVNFSAISTASRPAVPFGSRLSPFVVCRDVEMYASRLWHLVELCGI